VEPELSAVCLQTALAEVTCLPGALPVAISGLTATSMTVTVFWYVAPSCLVETDRRLRAMSYSSPEIVNTSETKVSFYQITRYTILEDSHLPVSSCSACEQITCLWTLRLDISAGNCIVTRELGLPTLHAGGGARDHEIAALV
jgi:hypothetical protein